MSFSEQTTTQRDTVAFHIGQRLRGRREDLGLSIAELCARLESEIPDYASIEASTHRPNPKQLIDLSEVLGVPLSYFFEAQSDQAASTTLRAPPSSDSS